MFAGRERELTQLQSFLDRAVGGRGQIAFIAGEAGTGKSALLQEFARRAQANHAKLVVIGGNCNAYTGTSDPYLPFREILEQLVGDPEVKDAKGILTSENAQRLQALLARSLQILVETGPDLINVSVWFYQLQRDSAATDELLDPLTTLGAKEGFSMLSAAATWAEGWVIARQGRVAEGIALMQEGIRAWQDTGSIIWQPRFLITLAEVHLSAGQVREATTVLTETETLIEKTKERLWLAEVYRLLGEASRLREADPAVAERVDAEAYFHRAIECARQQQGKMYELQATMSLCRLWDDQGKRSEAHDLLTGIYGWFTEGRDTTLLQEAKALLETLTRFS